MVLLLSLVLLALPYPSTADTAPYEDGRIYAKFNGSVLAMRLANGSRCAGRVEIFYGADWGTVCDDLWDMSDAQVVCRQMRCGNSISFHVNAYFGQGRGPIFLDDISCQGNETYLWNCTHRGLAKHNCGHSEDAGVTCTGPSSTRSTTSDNTTAMATETSTTTGPSSTGSTTSDNNTAMATETSTTTAPQSTGSTTPDNTTAMATETSTTTGSSTSSSGPSSTAQVSTPETSTASSTEPSSSSYTTQESPTETPEYIRHILLQENNVDHTCGEILTESNGRISSPLYPSSYPLNTRCTWEIRSAPNTFIELHFSHMNLENSTNCTYDSVAIYDGGPESTLLERICQITERTFRSNSNVMTIVFTSDGSIRKSGFDAYYTTSTATNSMSEFTKNCGGTLTDLQGVFDSSRTGSPDSDYCVWHILVDNNYKIHLQFSIFLMKDSLSCHSFSLSVYDGTPEGSPLLGQLCGTTGRIFTSSSNSMSIVYTKSHDDTDAGLEFSASYYSIFQNNTNVTLSCHSDYMETQVSLQYLKSLGFSSNNVFLNDPECRPEIQSDWLVFHIPYQNCRTHSQVINDTIAYENVLFTDSAEPVVMYRKKLRFTVRCQMNQETIVDSLYVADDIMEDSVNRYGQYSANLTFFTSENFTYPVYQYPYYVELNQNLYLQATLDTTDPFLVLFVDTCVASPVPLDMSENVYQLISNGCPRVSDYRSYHSSSPSTARIGFSAFSFLRRYSSVYIRCRLVVCKQEDRWSRCNQGCRTRHKRAVESHQEHVHVVAGPIKLLNY